MIDAVGLLFAKRIPDYPVELACRSEIGSKRLFDDYASPASFTCFIQVSRFQVLQNRVELVGSGRKIKKAIASRPMIFVDFIEALSQTFIAGLVVEFALVVTN